MHSSKTLFYRYIKMSSPYLNNMIIIGCLLTYTSVILLGLDSHLTSESALPVICTARIWSLMAGFTLAFGSMFSKTWRVHSIFTDVKLNKKVKHTHESIHDVHFSLDCLLQTDGLPVCLFLLLFVGAHCSIYY